MTKMTAVAEIKKEMNLETEKAIRSHSCKRCDGVIVKSYALSMLSMMSGKRCSCKSQ